MTEAPTREPPLQPVPPPSPVDPRVWLWPLLATLLIQTTAAYLSRLPPTIGPVLTAEAGLTASTVGHLAAVSTLGSVVFLLAGTPLIRRAGPIRALQLGLALGAVGVLLLALPVLPVLLGAAFLIGLGYGPSAPAGSDVLQRHAPPQHRNLIFSIKQAGVPVGGMIGGLILPPIVDGWGWRWALVVSVVMALGTVALVEPLRARIDQHRDRSLRLRLSSFLSPTNLRGPIVAMNAAPGLARMAGATAGFAIGQGVWFAFLVTYCVVELRMSLTAAGVVFAVMQGTGVFGRVLLGWLSDRAGSGLLILKAVAVASAATSLTLAATGPSWPFWAVCLLAGIGGVTVSSWNGVQVAEVARLAPKNNVAETAAGATMIVFIGYVVGPASFALLVGLTGRYDIGYVATGLCAVTSFLILRPMRHRT